MRTHVARLAAFAALLALAAAAGSLPAMLVCAAALWLAAFATAHDLVHDALGLGRHATDRALTLVSLVLLGSGHAMRVSHLLHHKRPLADDDYEGAAARGDLGRALALAPWWSIAARLRAFTLAGQRLRRRQLVEHALVLAALVLALASGLPVLRLYVAVASVAHVSAPVWAGRVPHRAPAWLLALAASLSWTGSPTALALAYHERHHARPHMPCARLADA
jgi:fatty acid desaturase